MLYSPEHLNIRDAVRRFVDAEINPYVDEWEDNEGLPAHELFKKLASWVILASTSPRPLAAWVWIFPMPWQWLRVLVIATPVV